MYNLQELDALILRLSQQPATKNKTLIFMATKITQSSM